MPEQRVYTNRYEIVRHLARGGMAEVYLAHDQLLDRRVALKVLFPEFARDPAFVQRFRREAQAAANLNHPNIVAVFDWGEEDGTYFIVMEYVEGRSVREAIQSDGPLYPNLAADLASDIAGALGFAHRNGVVHRDVKPGNILLTPQGQVKVTDFGIARAAGASESLTQTGSVMGTATYFSPEQAQGLPVDARSDVYSLGVVLYEMVCGVPPFSGESPISVAYKHVREEPPKPTVVNPDVPVALENIILTAMAKLPDGRYASADDMRADLARFRRGEQTSAVPLMAVPVSGADVTVVNPQMDKVYDRTTVGTVVPSPTIPTAPRRSAAPFVLVLIGLLALLAGLGYLLAKQLSGDGGGELVTVGNYIGQKENDARLLIEHDGLKADITTEVNEQRPLGEVFAQEPDPGIKIDEGRDGQAPGQRRQGRGAGARRGGGDARRRPVAPGRRRVPVPGHPGDERLGRRRQGHPHGSRGRCSGAEGLGGQALRLRRQGAGGDPRRVRPGPGRGLQRPRRQEPDRGEGEPGERLGRGGQGHRHQPGGRYLGGQGIRRSSSSSRRARSRSRSPTSTAVPSRRRWTTSRTPA